MTRVFFLTPFALAAVAGCAPAPNQIQAGQWETVVEQRSIDIPGAPAEMQRVARADIGRAQRNTTCFTEEQARDFLQFIKRGQPPGCTFGEERYAGGQMRLRMTCAGPNGQAGGQMTLDGNFSRTTFNATVDEQRPNPTGANNGPVRISASIRGRRLGECPAGGAMPPMPGQPS